MDSDHSSSDSEDCVQITASDILRNQKYEPKWPHENSSVELVENVIATLRQKKKSRNKVRKQYKELISVCNDLKSGDRIPSEKVLSENVNKAKTLFERGPKEMYSACSHANMFSEMVQRKSENVGAWGAAFQLHAFLRALKGNHETPNGGYSCHELVNAISEEHNQLARTVPTMISMMGKMDMEKFEKDALDLILTVADKKRRSKRKKQLDESQQTAYTDVNDREEKRKTRDNSASTMSKDLLRIIKIYYKQNNMPLELFNFTMDKESFANMIKYVFYVSFLVRDGRVSLKRDQKNRLVVKPEAPIRRVKGTVYKYDTFILTITPQQYKAMAQAAQGEDIITAYRRAHMPTVLEEDVSTPMGQSFDPGPQPSTSKQAAAAMRQNTCFE